MNDFIISTLSSLNIPVAFMSYKGSANAYIMFQVYNEADSDYADDESEAEITYISLNYWYKDSAGQNRIKEIKRLMKKAGFIFDGGEDLYDKETNTYGRNLDFIYKEYL